MKKYLIFALVSICIFWTPVYILIYIVPWYENSQKVEDTQSDEETLLRQKIGKLEIQVINQTNEINFLRDEKANQQNSIPNNYYTNGNKNGSSKELINYLNNTFSMPTEYKLHVFDCSEKAAFMERELENAGFDTKIAVGDSPFNTGNKHAWIIVKTSDNYLVAIEPTAILGGMDGETQSMFSNFSNEGRGIVYSNQNKSYYDGYEYLFEDINATIQVIGIEEIDWWLGMWDLEP